ncbi:hypothetical protein D3273_14930 [Lichenibacterium minor]|jgi:hypothetical protein|uniref:Uncharacterized protein n=1 Tax=Lichenibacterium minor TaxID=2316528 RepID=A0A4V1RUH6_9HYPH|nr:hypothetical protein [Lichenibacterium minor]RYC31184.1 hypothetical protein D3273_14930 [Lichenibacterium minor]
MSAITSNIAASRSSAHRDYRVLLGLTYPLFVAGVALRRVGLLPADPVRPASFIAAVRTRAAAVIPFAFMG